jgi:hypothetical protein
MPSRSKKERRRERAAAAGESPASRNDGSAPPHDGPEPLRAGTGPFPGHPRTHGPVAPPLPGERRFTIRHAVAAAVLLAVFAVQGYVAATRDSVTIDESGHMPLGLHILETGDLRDDPINSHLSRMFMALPVMLEGPVFDPPDGTVTWGYGAYFQQANAERYQHYFVEARAMMLLLSLVAACLMAKWTLDLYGANAALASLALFAFAPSLLAHGHLATIDMAGVLGFLLALYVNWWMLEAPSIRRAACVGLALGAANLLKLSGPVLVACIVATWAVRIVMEPRRRIPLLRWVAMLATAGAVTVLTLNAGYAFDGTFALLGDAPLKPGGKLATLAQAMPWLRLPLPTPFLHGVDMVLEVGKGHEPSYFLWGELSADGWWYYHLAAFAAKCPLPVLLAALFSLFMWARGRSRGRRDYAVFLPIVLLFGANSAFNSLYIGERHVLAAYPLFFIVIAPWIVAGTESVRALLRRDDAAAPASRSALELARAWMPGALTALGLVWLVAGTLSVSPRYLQYFNEWAGGPEGGHRVLIDSNIDWGQDLIRLREYMDANAIDSVALAYFGRVHPGVYGIKFTPLERGVSRGKAVVSATFLMGRPYFWYLGGRMRWVPARTYEWLRGHKPVARVGSMFVFDLP